MAYVSSSFLLFWTLTLSLAHLTSCARVNACPKLCSCKQSTSGPGGDTIDCSSKDLVTLPATPRTTVAFDLSHNKLGPVIEASFTGQMSNLTTLDISYNGLTRILACTLQGMLKLQSLSLRGNQLQVLPDSLFADNNMLEKLDLAENQLNSLLELHFLRHLPRLTALDVSRNNFSTLRLGARFGVPRDLKILDLSHNQLMRIPEDAFDPAANWASVVNRSLNMVNCSLYFIAPRSLPKIPNLHTLRLSDNPRIPANNLTQVLKELESQSKLKELFLSGTGLQSVTPLFSDITTIALVVLDVSNNSIENLTENDMATVSSLRVLNFSHNKLPAATAGFGKLLNLMSLNVSYNELRSFNGDSIRRMSNLRSLDLSHNLLRDARSVDASSFVRLQHLILHNNELTALPSLPFNTSALQTLDLHDNMITEFNGLDDSSNLQTIDLSNNELARLGSYLFKKGLYIKSANFCGNIISRLDNRAFLPQSPLVLDLSNNALQEIQSPNWVATQQLNLAGNQLENLNAHTFYDMGGLMTLDLSRNKLSWLPEDLLQHLDALRSLDISHNRLGDDFEDSGPREKIFWNRLFRNLAVLRILNLSHNKISDLSDDSLQPLQSLQVLNLDTNRLATVYPKVFHDCPSLKELILSNNPFHCSCDLLALRDWLSRPDIPVVGLYSPGSNMSYACAAPESRKGFHVTVWGPDEFECNKSILYLIIFGCLAVLLVVGLVAGIGGYRLYKQKRTMREEKRRRRARILKELEQIRKAGKDDHDREAEMVLVSREIAAEIEDALENKSKAPKKYRRITKEHRGVYVPWPLGEEGQRKREERGYNEGRDTRIKQLSDDRQRREADYHKRFQYPEQNERVALSTSSKNLDRHPSNRDVPRVVKLDRYYPYMVREAIPVAERVEWIPRHDYQEDGHYADRSFPRRGQPHVVTYKRAAIDSHRRHQDIWTATNDYHPIKYWTLPGSGSRDEFVYPEARNKLYHEDQPLLGKSARNSVRFEDTHDLGYQSDGPHYVSPRPGSYEYWRRYLHGNRRSLSQSHLLGGEYSEDEIGTRTRDTEGHQPGDQGQQRQYESIAEQAKINGDLGQRTASQPQLTSHGNTSGWL